MGILRWLMAAVVLGGLPATAQVADLRSTTQFRVCADPANAPMCDVVMGYAQGDELVQNTNHYYTSVFGIVTRKDGDLAGVDHLSDPALKGHPIGVIAGSPPATIMARAGLAKDMRGADLFVDRRVKDPVGDLIRGVKDGTLDAASCGDRCPVLGSRTIPICSSRRC